MAAIVPAGARRDGNVRFRPEADKLAIAMKRGTAKLIIMFVVLAGPTPASAAAEGRHVESHDPCSTFVTGSRPVLRQGVAGLELLARMSVSTQTETGNLLRAASRGAFDVVIFPGRETVRATGIEDGQLVLEVNSATHAEVLAHALCLGIPTSQRMPEASST